ncbi:hypothetical protein CH063_09817, partial [Colletotrichum higginsianum]
MAKLFAPVVAALLPAVLVTAAPTAVSNATGNGCTVTEYADIANAVATCTDITLSNIAAPANSPIDLQKLQQGATVTFDGTT